MGDLQKRDLFLGLFIEVAKERALPVGPEEGGFGMSYDLLYGRAGFLWGALFVNKHLGEDAVPKDILMLIIDAVLAGGRAGASDIKDCPLMYRWHGTRYLGAANGLAGILHVLLHFPLPSEDAEDVKGTLWYLMSKRFPHSGNYPSSEGNPRDKLVQWGHGATGMAITLSKAAEVFPNDRELRDAAIEAGEVVWKSGLVKKVGLADGVSGNAYAFLSLYRLTKESIYEERAKSFASFLYDNAKSLAAANGYSLFQGLAGTACLWFDLLAPDNSRSRESLSIKHVMSRNGYIDCLTHGKVEHDSYFWSLGGNNAFIAYDYELNYLNFLLSSERVLKESCVCDKGKWFVSCKDVPMSRRNVVFPSMFPNGGNYQDVVDTENPVMHEFTEEVSDFPLERFMRLLPHDQNTGAFFIAVLQKVSPLPDAQELQVNPLESTPEEISEANINDNGPNTDLKVSSATFEEVDFKAAQDPCNVENITKNTPGKRKLQIQGKWRGIDPVVFFKDEVVINSIKEFYAIDEQFPFNGHLVTRNSDTSHMKRIYYISKSVKDVLELNFSVGQQLKITSVGLKIFPLCICKGKAAYNIPPPYLRIAKSLWAMGYEVFIQIRLRLVWVKERQTSCEGRSAPCAFRITSEGLPLILPHISKQILSSSAIDFKHLLQYRAVKFADFVDAKFGERAANLMPGCCVVVLGRRGAAWPLQVDESTIAIGCWKGRASLTVMVGALECQELLERLIMRLEKVTEKDSSMHKNRPSDNKGDEAQESNGKNEDVEITGC
ncbi:LanC-like protein GCL1 [Glycine soja]|uniref:LanC-like protein GCL1 n=1 Tax=Glycine soja TaxID=3848 RepID=A0A445FMR8_GLYSO|nr:LanC-like protein GCL1 [Glycine soja]